MDITPYLVKSEIVFSLATTIDEVKEIFSKTTFTHFPVVENKKFIGLIDEDDIKNFNLEYKTIADCSQYLCHFFVDENENLIEILKLFAINESNILPVVSKSKQYIGFYELKDALFVYNETDFLKTEGINLCVEKNQKDFSMSEVSQIVESSNGKILGILLSEIKNDKAKIYIKFSSNEPNEIIQTFRRYGYTIITELEDDHYLSSLKDRSNYLTKYLNI